MSAPPVNFVAWRSAQWTTWHIEYSDAQGRTLCLRLIPPDAPCTRAGIATDRICGGCLKVWDHETAKRLRLETV